MLNAKAEDHGWTKTNGGYITTYTGRRFYFNEPTPEMIDIEDIAHALAQQCRFSGHTRRFLSVAEHSLYVSALSANKLEGLLHDAAEAYMIDIPSPLKAFLPDYKLIEHKIASVIMKKFGLSYPISEDCKDADTAQLISEAKWLLADHSWTTLWNSSKVGITPDCMGPRAAKEAFLYAFSYLTKSQLTPQLELPLSYKTQ